MKDALTLGLRKRYTNKASGGDAIPAELFKILKDDAVKVPHSICQQIWKTHQWPNDWKMSVFIPIPKKGNAKECSDYHTIALISHGSKVMLKILQARLQQYTSWELLDVHLGKAEEPEIKLPTSVDHRESKGIPGKHLLLLHCAKAFDSMDHKKLWKILKEVRIPTILPAP